MKFLLFLVPILLSNCVFCKAFVLIGPSGVGKSTLIDGLRETGLEFDELVFHTTRPMRDFEKNKRDYFFITKEEYRRIEGNGEFLTSTLVHGNLYGIKNTYIESKFQEDTHLVCSLNTEAAKKIKKIFGNDIVTIFITPPSFEVLEKRLFGRGTEDKEAAKLRLQNACGEIEQQNCFDYKIVNSDFRDALEDLKSIFFLETRLEYRSKQEILPIGINVIRTMSYNIRMAPCPEDDETENAWKHRLPKIKMVLTQYLPDIVGFQEVSLYQMDTIKNCLKFFPYKFLGKYPTTQPVESGLGIVYNSEKLLLVSDIHRIWLNESKDRPGGPAWDSSTYERYAIYAKFKNLLNGKFFWFMTTHFDHLGIKARGESAKIVMNLAEELDAPTIISGDFNCFPQLGGQELYKLLCTHSSIMKDSEHIARSVFGVPGSWIGWDYDHYKQREECSKYDFIFVENSIEVVQHGIIDDRVWDSDFQKELYPSDHRPVISDLRL